MPDTLNLLAGYAELRGDHERTRVLSEAAAALGAVTVESRRQLIRAALNGTPSYPGLHPSVTAVLARILDEGRDSVLTRARAELPPDLARLLAVPGLSVADVVAVHRRTGAVTAGDLAYAVSLGHPEGHSDDALQRRIEAALPSVRVGHPRIPLGRAVSLYERVKERVREALPDTKVLEPTGSMRRFEPTVGDVEFLLETISPTAAFDAILAALAPVPVLHRGPEILGIAYDGQPLVIRAVAGDRYAFAQLYYTGSTAHISALQRHASERGWRLTPAGFSPGPPGPFESEAEIYAILGLAYVEPELRLTDELLHPDGSAPASLLTRTDIRGDLHVHTLWSDGRDSVEAMVRTALRLGYEYVAITDHSQSAAASRVLTIERLERQLDEIERVQTRVAGIHVLRGVEVDILPDGSLDFPDTLLERLDIVLASLHDAAGQAPDRLLQRYLSAMKHPKVNIITHPANRLVGRDEGYALDFDALFTAAVETGTVLEVDGGPAHLDMDGALARRAVAAGVMVSVDSDCHNAERLERQMVLGVGTARRGGLEARHVLNARPLEEVLAFFARKRAQSAVL